MNAKEIAAVLEQHRLWLDEGEGQRADLTGADLSFADLSDADLREAVLTDADLSDANLSGANLSKACLHLANLHSADLIGVNLTGADLHQVDLARAVLTGAHLAGADLFEAVLRWAKLVGAGLEGADLRGADLSFADLSFANLTGADLTGAILSGTTLRYALLEGVTWPDGKPTATVEESDALARRIAQQVLDKPELLDMEHWHCGTKHCLAGWAKVLTDGETVSGTTQVRGFQLLPTLSHLFFAGNHEALEALQELLGKS